MNKFLIVIIVVIIIALGAGGYYLFKGKTPADQNNNLSGDSLVAVTIQKGGSINELPKSEPKIFSQTVAIDSEPYSFKPDFFRVKLGEKATVIVTSYGNHTFTIDELKINVKTADGKKTQFSFTPSKKGAFHFYSSIPGDREAGQQGTLMVE